MPSCMNFLPADGGSAWKGGGGGAKGGVLTGVAADSLQVHVVDAVLDELLTSVSEILVFRPLAK